MGNCIHAQQQQQHIHMRAPPIHEQLGPDRGKSRQSKRSVAVIRSHQAIAPVQYSNNFLSYLVVPRQGKSHKVPITEQIAHRNEIPALLSFRSVSERVYFPFSFSVSTPRRVRSSCTNKWVLIEATRVRQSGWMAREGFPYFNLLLEWISAKQKTYTHKIALKRHSHDRFHTELCVFSAYWPHSRACQNAFKRRHKQKWTTDSVSIEPQQFPFRCFSVTDKLHHSIH